MFALILFLGLAHRATLSMVLWHRVTFQPECILKFTKKLKYAY